LIKKEQKKESGSVMAGTYLLRNNYEIMERTREFDSYIPLTIIHPLYGGGLKYIEYEGSNSHLIIKISGYLKIIVQIKLIAYSSSLFYNQPFNDKNFLQLQSCLALDLNESLECEEGVTLSITQDYETELHIFTDAILILIVQPLCPTFIIYESEMLSALADKDFNLIGFMTRNITPEIINWFQQEAKYKLGHKPIPLEIQPTLTCGEVIMENKEALIKKMLDLKNIDFIALLYYGLHRELINDSFCVDFAMKALGDQVLTTPLIVDLASILTQEEITRDLLPSKLIEESVKNKDEILIEKGQFYNKIWFYLTLAADVYALGLSE
jgi:hypothetical protein